MKTKNTYKEKVVNEYKFEYFNKKLFRIVKFNSDYDVIADIKFKSTKDYVFDAISYYVDGIMIYEGFYNNNKPRVQSCQISTDGLDMFLSTNLHGEVVRYDINGTHNNYYYYKNENITEEMRVYSSTESEQFQRSVLYGNNFKLVSEYTKHMNNIKDEVTKILKDKKWDELRKI